MISKVFSKMKFERSIYHHSSLVCMNLGFCSLFLHYPLRDNDIGDYNQTPSAVVANSCF